MATATKNNKKTALLIGGAAAGLAGLYLLTRGSSSSSTDQTDAFSTYGGFTGGGFTEGTAIGVTDKGAGTDYDINALLEGINNLNAEQVARQQELYNQYLKQIQTPTTPTTSDTINPTPYGGGSAADEIADRVSNPGGSATKLTDLEQALRGHDLDMSDVNAIYGNDTAKFTTEGIYQILPGGGLAMAGGASNAYQATGKNVTVTRLPNGNISVTGLPGASSQVYTSTGQFVTGYDVSGSGPSTSTGGAPYSSGKSPTTTKTQSGGTSTTPSSPAPTTASTSPSAGSIASKATSATPMGAALNAVTGGGFSKTVSNVVNSVSSFIGGLFK